MIHCDECHVKPDDRHSAVNSRMVGLGVFGLFMVILLLMAPGIDFYLSSPDHGHQLSLGRQVLLGRFPFVDLFFKYGPLTAFTSAFGIWIWDCLVPETIICAAGYALTLATVFVIVRRYSSTIAAALGSFAGLMLLARFYKWYYWLFPVLVLYCVNRWLQAKSDQIGWLFLGGIVGGAATLFRFDLGLACGCFLVLFVGLLSMEGRRLGRAALNCAVPLVGWAVPMCLWLIALGYRGRMGAVADYFASTYAGVEGSLIGMAVPIPMFDWNEPWSYKSRAALAFLLLPCTYAAGIAYATYRIRYAHTDNDPRYRFILGAGIMGLGVFPQALHRADVGHLQQVLPPFLIVVSLLVWDLVRENRCDGRKPWHRKARIVAGAGLVAACVVTFVAVFPLVMMDLESRRWDVANRYRALVAECRGDVGHPVCEILSAMNHGDAELDPVLVAGSACQLNYFSRRPLSGILIAFEPAYFDTDRWRVRQLKAVQLNPPAFVVAPEGFLKYPPGHWFRVCYPELYGFLAKNYRSELKRAGSLVLLGYPVDSTDHTM